jgi:hypothetical protein
MNVFEDTEKYKKTILHFFTLDIFAILQGQRRLFCKCLGGAKTFVFLVIHHLLLLRVFGRAWQVRTLGATC